jgi:hypothetical protein
MPTGRSAAATGKGPVAERGHHHRRLGHPLSLLVEVLFTLGQTEFAKFHLMVLQGGKKK